jgi:hypothetical protein
MASNATRALFTANGTLTNNIAATMPHLFNHVPAGAELRMHRHARIRLLERR